MTRSSWPDLVLFDGQCALCDGFVRFVVARDRQRFGFASLDGPAGRAVLGRAGPDARGADALCVVVGRGTAGERFLVRSRAVLHVLRHLPGWRWTGVLRLVPWPLADLVYRVVAALRYRLWGRVEGCALPRPEEPGRFLDEL